MRKTYDRRSKDFKRRIIKTNIQSKKEMFEEENRYLQMIKQDEFKIRYYNIKNTHVSFYSDGCKEETKVKISHANKGRVFSEEHKQKLRESHKGQIAWNKGKKGKPHTEEHKKRVSEKLKNRYFSEEHRRKISESLKGRKMLEKCKIALNNANKGRELSEEHKKKVSENNARFWKGKSRSEETKRKISDSLKKRNNTVIELYTRNDCTYCVRAKNLLQSLGLEYKTYIIGEQLSRDDVLAKFPNAVTLPIVVVNGVHIGGYEQMEQAIMENKETFGKTQLNEGK